MNECVEKTINKILAKNKMDINPLPSQDSDLSDSDQSSQFSNSLLVTYVVRVTPCGKFTFQQFADQLDKEYMFCNFVLSRETVPQEHFHLVVQVDDSNQEIDVRDVINAFIKPFWTVNGKLPRGYGNKQYNLQLCKDVDKAVSYAVKQGEFIFQGFEEEYINACKAQSFEKNKPSNFKSEYRDLCTEFQKSDMDIREFMLHFTRLKAKYDQIINLQHVYGYALSQIIKRDNNAEMYVDNFLDRL